MIDIVLCRQNDYAKMDYKIHFSLYLVIRMSINLSKIQLPFRNQLDKISHFISDFIAQGLGVCSIFEPMVGHVFILQYFSIYLGEPDREKPKITYYGLWNIKIMNHLTKNTSMIKYC